MQGAIDYGKFRTSLERLREQHENYREPHAGLPALTREAIAESVIQRFETCYPAFLILFVRQLYPATGAPQGPFAPLPLGATPTPTLPLRGGGRRGDAPPRARSSPWTDDGKGPLTLLPLSRGEPSTLLPLSGREPSTLLPPDRGEVGRGVDRGPAMPRNPRSSTGMRNAGYRTMSGEAWE